MKTTNNLGLAAGLLASATALGGCVWQSDYDALQAKNTDLSAQVASQQSNIDALKAQNDRLIGAIKYTVNSDLLFPSGGWEMSEQGKTLIARFAAKLAPTQQNKLLVAGYTDNVPISPALAAQGVTSNQVLSEKRADNVEQYLISQGLKPELVEAKGFGEENPVASNETKSGRAQNRRVELSLAPSGT